MMEMETVEVPVIITETQHSIDGYESTKNNGFGRRTSRLGRRNDRFGHRNVRFGVAETASSDAKTAVSDAERVRK